MTIKTLVTSALLALSPLAAYAACGHEQQAMSCAEGMQYDAESGSCKAVTG